jgi:dTDP-4-dehydrorhamnose reductase
MLVQDQPSRPEVPSTGPAPSRAGKVLVTGASGLLGSTLCTVLAGEGHHLIRHGRTRLAADDLAFPLEELALIEPAIGQGRPDWIIHAAANTSVEACETDPAAAHRLHVEASAELARAARLHGSRLIYVSTDSVYDGGQNGGHAEDDAPQPVNHYAQTKWEGEQACLHALPTTIVARVNFYGLPATRTHGLAAWIVQSLEAGRGLDGFTDVHFSPLLNHHLAELFALALARDLPGGTYNFGASDHCSKYEFARRIASLLGVNEQLVRPALLASAGFRTLRPNNTVLNTGKLAGALGRSMPTVNDGLERLFQIPLARQP